MNVGDATAILGVLGGIALFAWGLYQWQDSQQWRRAEKLELFIKEFDSNELLVFGRVVLDWTRRTVVFQAKSVTVSNTDALLALRVHSNLPEHNVDGTVGLYTGSQPQIRDALDALLRARE